MNSVCNSSQSPFLLFIKPHSPTISCSIRRRRPNRHNNNNNNNYYSSSNNPYNSNKRSSQSSEQNVEMVIDVERIKAQAATTFKSVSRSVQLGLDQFVLSGKDIYKDLQTLICFDNNGRIYVSCKRSSLLFMGDVLIYSLLLFFGVRFLAGLVVGIKNKIGLGHGGSGSVVVRRDRSLGGKQVVVGNHGRMKENVKALNNPLMPSWETALKDMESGLKDRVRTSNKLPAWWPALLTEPSLMVDIEENQRNANRLIRAITDNRMGGRDIFNSDIVQLRRICRASGVRVNIETKNVRDSIYRAAVDLVLNSCSSTISETASVEIDGEDARQFIAGLADNVGLERIRAARIVSAGVAARTRDFVTHTPTGRFCNGKLATDFTAEFLGFTTYPPAYLSQEAKGKSLLTGVNFASGASGYFDRTAQLYSALSLPQQVQYYKEYQTKVVDLVGKAKANTIFSGAINLLSAGSSDFVQNYYVNPLLNRVYTVDQFSELLISSYSAFVQNMYGLGARRIGVTNLPPLGCLPAAITLLGGSNQCVPRLNQDALSFNAKLNNTSQGLAKKYPDMKLVVLDIYQPLLDMVTKPSANGFFESRKACCGTGTVETAVLCNARSVGTCSNATGYVFWDGFHPSEAANQILANALLTQGIDLVT